MYFPGNLGLTKEPQWISRRNTALISFLLLLIFFILCPLIVNWYWKKRATESWEETISPNKTILCFLYCLNSKTQSDSHFLLPPLLSLSLHFPSLPFTQPISPLNLTSFFSLPCPHYTCYITTTSPDIWPRPFSGISTVSPSCSLPSFSPIYPGPPLVLLRVSEECGTAQSWVQFQGPDSWLDRVQ